METVLGRYFLTTLQLMVGVGVVAILFGVSTAWIISRYQFVLLTHNTSDNTNHSGLHRTLESECMEIELCPDQVGRLV